MSLAGISAGIASSLFSTGSAPLPLQTSVSRSQGGVGSLANDTVSLSGQGRFLSKLQALQASNPQKFKQVLSQVASELQTAAGQAGNTSRAQSLSSLANKFQDVANGGDLAQLKPATYSNRVQRAYGANQPDSMQELFNAFGQSQTAGSVQQGAKPNAATGSAAPSATGTDPHYVLMSVVNNLNRI
jgi:hypothetical protein